MPSGLQHRREIPFRDRFPGPHRAMQGARPLASEHASSRRRSTSSRTTSSRPPRTTGSRQEQQVLFEAMSQTKKHRGELAAEFDRRFLEIFDKRITSKREGLSREHGAAPRGADARRRRRGRGAADHQPARPQDPQHHRPRPAARHPRALRPPAVDRAAGRGRQPDRSRGGPRGAQARLRPHPRRHGGEERPAVRVPALHRARHGQRLRRREPEPDRAPRAAAHQAHRAARARHRRRRRRTAQREHEPGDEHVAAHEHGESAEHAPGGAGAVQRSSAASPAAPRS